MNPIQIKSKLQLQETYNLRVTAYENSPQAAYVNSALYPNGWSDDLDEHDGAVHWIILDKNKIIAAARLVILNDISLLGQEFTEVSLPEKSCSFAYWSRLVVHPDYRRTKAMLLLDRVRKTHIINNPQIKFAISCVIEARSKSLLRQGFECIGEIMYHWGGQSKQRKMLVHLLKRQDVLLPPDRNHTAVLTV